jgi:ribosomal protein S6--L-glutamate ligase
MRVIVLSRQRLLYATRRFHEAARRMGHRLRVLDPLACTLVLDPGGTRLVHRGREIRSADCAIPRIGAALPGEAVAVVTHLEAMGVPTLNRSEAIRRARDKLLTLQILASRGISVPRTVLARSPESLDYALELVGGPPVVLKLLHGAQGVGVILVESRSMIGGTLDTLWALGHDVLIQEFVAESRGRDVRALVIGGRVIAAMRRQARGDEWRSNLHRGGVGESLSLEAAFERAAIESTRALGLDVAGVDLLEGRNGPQVIEVNASPGFEGLERVTGMDIAGAILRHAERIARPTALQADRFTG